jgi:uncharacterized membrane protein
MHGHQVIIIRKMSRFVRSILRSIPFLVSGIGLLNPIMAHLVLTYPSLAATTTRNVFLVVSGVSHTMIYTGLGATFGLSLRPGEEALVSRIARRVEPFPAQAIMSYTRGVTWLWTIFCIMQLLVSGGLLALTGLSVWSVFVGLANLPLVIATFLAEYVVRRWRFRHQTMASFAETIRFFSRCGADLPKASS